MKVTMLILILALTVLIHAQNIKQAKEDLD